MAAPEIIAHLEQQGFRMEADGDRIKVTPSSRLTDELRAQIRSHKSEILAALQNDIAQAVTEAVNERQAILEHDGGLSRSEADRVAELAAEFYQHLFADAKRTGCCYAPVGRYCEEGRRLRDRYYGAVS